MDALETKDIRNDRISSDNRLVFVPGLDWPNGLGCGCASGVWEAQVMLELTVFGAGSAAFCLAVFVVWGMARAVSGIMSLVVAIGEQRRDIDHG